MTDVTTHAHPETGAAHAHPAGDHGLIERHERLEDFGSQLGQPAELRQVLHVIHRKLLSETLFRRADRA